MSGVERGLAQTLSARSQALWQESAGHGECGRSHMTSCSGRYSCGDHSFICLTVGRHGVLIGIIGEDFTSVREGLIATLVIN